MKAVDAKRRTTLKGMAALSALATFGTSLYASADKSIKKTVVLLNDSLFAKQFAEGVQKSEDSLNTIENVNLIEDYASFTKTMKKHLSNKDVTTLTGLLTEGDYALLVEMIKDNGLKLKTEIVHDIAEHGTAHHISATHTASSVLSSAKSALESNSEWAYLTGYILGGGCADSVLASIGKNDFNQVTIKKAEKGDTKLVSFLATISKERSNV